MSYSFLRQATLKFRTDIGIIIIYYVFQFYLKILVLILRKALLKTLKYDFLFKMDFVAND